MIVKGICNSNIHYFYWRDWNDETLELACKELTREMKPEDDMERKEFRLTLVLSYFFKFMNQVKLFLEVKYSICILTINMKVCVLCFNSK